MGGKIALVITVKNEERILRNNLLYHLAIGVDRAFVYFDNSTDNGKSSIFDLDFVTIADSVPAEKYGHLEYLNKFTSQAAEHHTARQCLNTFDAQQKCKMESIDWLISLDADELICTDADEPSDLKLFFKKLEEEVEVVSFKVLEVLQQKTAYTNVFAEETLFKANLVAFHKKIFNPFSLAKERFFWWYGQGVGKCAVRINSYSIPKSVHHFRNLNDINSKRIVKGFLLHYNAYDAEDFIKKFTNFKDRPDTFLSGREVDHVKLLLRDVVNHSGYSNQQLVDYFIKNLMFHEKEIKKFKRKRKYLFFTIEPKPLLEILSVKKTFRNIFLES